MFQKMRRHVRYRGVDQQSRRRDRATSNKVEPGRRAMAPPSSRPLYSAKLTQSSGATRREKSLLPPPVRIIVVSTVVGDWLPTTPAGVDRVDLSVGSGCVVDIGYLLTGRRVGRVVVARTVVGDVELAPSVGLDRVDLGVGSGSGVVVGIGYPLAAGSVVGVVVLRGVVGNVELAPTADLDGVDLGVVSVISLVSDPLAAR